MGRESDVDGVVVIVALAAPRCSFCAVLLCCLASFSRCVILPFSSLCMMFVAASRAVAPVKMARRVLLLAVMAMHGGARGRSARKQ